jgi:hypothetical protein
VVLGTNSRGSGAPWRSELGPWSYIFGSVLKRLLDKSQYEHLPHFWFLRLQFKGNPLCGFENEYLAEGKIFLA